VELIKQTNFIAGVYILKTTALTKKNKKYLEEFEGKVKQVSVGIE